MNSKFTRVLPLLAGSVGALQAATSTAQSSMGNFYYSGKAELEFLLTNTTEDSVLMTNLDFGLAPGSARSSIGFGLDFGLDILTRNGNVDEAIYAAGSIDTDFGRFSIGIPRPVIDTYVNMPAIGGTEGLAPGTISPFQMSSASYRYQFDGDLPLGARYDGDMGGVLVAASYHYLEGPDVGVLDLLGQVDMNAITLTGALEFVDLGAAGEDLNVMLSAEADMGTFRGGVLLSDVQDLAIPASALTGYATISPMRDLDLTASLIAIEQGTNNITGYGLSAEYQFMPVAYGQVGIADFDGQEAVLDLSIGAKF
ncbi:MAG: hypothetical protein HUJ27_04715 [Rhodobacteraceae bacterium]|nr:hypothetical protein [Paracoccaceae bacterium]